MIITAAVENDPEGTEAASLYRWLASDPDVSNYAGLSLTSHLAETGQMGVGLDLVQAIFSDGTGLASLGVAVASWRGTRPKHVRVTFKQGDKEVTLDSDDAKEIEKLLRTLLSDSGEE
jgi:Effector Associated Constant Component 1